MDYPEVTLVIQFNMPSSAEQYTHRLGRTGRAGKFGSGVLLLADFERNFLNGISDLPLTPLPPNRLNAVDAAELHTAMLESVQLLDNKTCELAYREWLGFYKYYLDMLGWDNETLVAEANRWYASFGIPMPPMMKHKIVKRMGLENITGLRIDFSIEALSRRDRGWHGSDWGGQGRGGDSRRFGRGGDSRRFGRGVDPGRFGGRGNAPRTDEWRRDNIPGRGRYNLPGYNSNPPPGQDHTWREDVPAPRDPPPFQSPAGVPDSQGRPPIPNRINYYPPRRDRPLRPPAAHVHPAAAMHRIPWLELATDQYEAWGVLTYFKVLSIFTLGLSSLLCMTKSRFLRTT
eukprot:gnl/MRDRNA2_/MRDRNA2_14614_c0_seq1.p1 gnl/MRDRNA2_/MRDRNA2_14614_c0~~gnl/MRDRNA2_/MRDRNA2_14614_c0_seq1.p1  ORF type:complete len:375 (+),score=37.27 gnl/MRDRNA2_/MRDRNA2_14614_c0_seq1:96-1127(+)